MQAYVEHETYYIRASESSGRLCRAAVSDPPGIIGMNGGASCILAGWQTS